MEQVDPAPSNYQGYTGEYDPPPAWSGPESKTARAITGAGYGLVVGLLLCLIWVIWANFVYRWSASRVSGLILTKYKRLNPDRPDGSFVRVGGITIAKDRKSALIDIELRNESPNTLISRVQQNWEIKSDMPCPLLERCVRV
jgi:hypothetical protein